MIPRRPDAKPLFAAACIGLASCATQPLPPVANPDHLPEPAFRFAYVLDHACYPYALGQKTEATAMAGIGFARDHVVSFPDPPGPAHLYSGRGGGPGVSIVGGLCSVRIQGDDKASFERATKPIFVRRSGADYQAHIYAADIPKGVFDFCVNGLMTKFYADQDLVLDKDLQRFNRPGYSVSVERFDCGRFEAAMARRALPPR
jgi:hypothetical protein